LRRCGRAEATGVRCRVSARCTGSAESEEGANGSELSHRRDAEFGELGVPLGTDSGELYQSRASGDTRHRTPVRLKLGHSGARRAPPCVFSLGLGLPFILTAFLIDQASNAFGRWGKNAHNILDARRNPPHPPRRAYTLWHARRRGRLVLQLFQMLGYDRLYNYL